MPDPIPSAEPLTAEQENWLRHQVNHAEWEGRVDATKARALLLGLIATLDASRAELERVTAGGVS